MRCPHCAGEIPDLSRFCGICGRYIDPADGLAQDPAGGGGGPAGGATRGRQTDAPGTEGQGGAARPGLGVAARSTGSAPGGSSLSLFELPVSRGARIARVALILALDAVLIGAGVAMIVSYLNARDRARRSNPEVEAEATVGTAEVQALPPEPVLRQPGSDMAARGPIVPARRETGEVRGRSISHRPRAARQPDADQASSEAARPAADASAPTGSGGADEPPAGEDGAPREAARPVGDAPTGPESQPVGSGVVPDAGATGGDAGGLSAEAEIEALGRRIAVMVEKHKAQLERCYRQAAKGSTPSEPLQGRVVLRFGIMPDGQPQNARAEENTTGSDRLATCVAAEIASWTFPEHAAAGALEFRWPFVFKAPR